MNMITYSERFKQEEKGERGENRNDHKWKRMLSLLPLLLWHAVSANLEHVENAKRKKTPDIASGTLTPPPGPAWGHVRENNLTPFD